MNAKLDGREAFERLAKTMGHEDCNACSQIQGDDLLVYK